MVGQVIRLPLRLIPPGLTVRIVSGPLRGDKWVVGAGVHGVWLGSYERMKIRRVQAALKPGDVFYDIGAHAGVYSLAAARAVGEGGTIVAVEPSEVNATRFARHMDLNRIGSVRLIAAAASDTVGGATFSRGPNNYQGRLQADGDMVVGTIRLDDIEPVPAVIKIDVEGHEASVLRGARRILELDRPVVFVAIHGSEARARCSQILETHDYEVEWLDSSELVAHPRRTR